MSAIADLSIQMPQHLHALSALPTPSLGLLGFNLEDVLANAGPWVLGLVSLIIFIESGVLFPFLPGDSLLFTTGLLHEQLGLNLWILLVSVSIAAILGDQVGYMLGHYFGRKMFSQHGKILNYENLDRAHNFFNRYGGKALVLARFVPIVRTFVPLTAGMAKYRYADFAKWNISGALLWCFLLTFAGVWLGNVTWIRDNVDMIVIVLVLVSVIPIAIEVMRERKKAQRREASPSNDTNGNSED
ncbi:VTT domain-containing protein [Rothia uropygialis]|uniref:VTT domain-containing protein n=1 Tax=Kocuria sp. 36 TaxID=1415402 RepID=UPI001EE8D681|nr:VTT domain-containing protein [Kocuria sp. 36]